MPEPAEDEVFQLLDAWMADDDNHARLGAFLDTNPSEFEALRWVENALRLPRSGRGWN